MKRKLTWGLLLAAASAQVLAAGPSAQVRNLAVATGLSEREVQMVLGARTAFPEYRTSYDRVEQRFIKALGEQRYDDLMAGRDITLDNVQHQVLAAR